MIGKSLCVASLAATLVACSHAGSITRTSADYTQAMATVRNEQLLLNIMRAAAREPLQFSAMGESTRPSTDHRARPQQSHSARRQCDDAGGQAQRRQQARGQDQPVVEPRVYFRNASPDDARHAQAIHGPWLGRGVHAAAAGARYRALVGLLHLAERDRPGSAIAGVAGEQRGQRRLWTTTRSAGKQIELQVADDKASKCCGAASRPVSASSRLRPAPRLEHRSSSSWGRDNDHHAANALVRFSSSTASG